MTTTTAPRKIEITSDQYRALQRPVQLPTPQALFDFIVETLFAKELVKFEHADPFRKKLPQGLFLLIPPRPAELDLGHLVGLIEFKGKRGVNYLNAGELADKITVPEGAYLMTDIEDGQSRLDTRLSVSEATILCEKRSPYVTFEGIIHAIVFPSVFETHNMDLCGSRCRRERVPFLSAGPRLHARWRIDARPRWGAPSCGSRIGG